MRKAAVGCLGLLLDGHGDLAEEHQDDLTQLWTGVLADGLRSPGTMKENAEMLCQCVAMIGVYCERVGARMDVYAAKIFDALIGLHHECASRGISGALQQEAVLALLKLCASHSEQFRCDWRRWVPLAVQEAPGCLSLCQPLSTAFASCWPRGNVPEEVARLAGNSFLATSLNNPEGLSLVLHGLVDALGEHAVQLFSEPQGVPALARDAGLSHSAPARLRSETWNLWLQVLKKSPTQMLHAALSPIGRYPSSKEALQCFRDYWVGLGPRVEDDQFAELAAVLHCLLEQHSTSSDVWEMVARCSSLQFPSTHATRFCEFWAKTLAHLCWSLPQRLDLLTALSKWFLSLLQCSLSPEAVRAAWYEHALRETARKLAAMHDHPDHRQTVFEAQCVLVNAALLTWKANVAWQRAVVRCLFVCRLDSAQEDPLENRILEALSSAFQEHSALCASSGLKMIYADAVQRRSGHAYSCLWLMRLFTVFRRACEIGGAVGRGSLVTLLQQSMCNALLLPMASTCHVGMNQRCQEFFAQWHQFYQWSGARCSPPIHADIARGIQPSVKKMLTFVEMCEFEPEPKSVFQMYVRLLEQDVVIPILGSLRDVKPADRDQALVVHEVYWLHRRLDVPDLDAFLANVKDFWIMRIAEHDTATTVLATFGPLISDVLAELNSSINVKVGMALKSFAVAVLEMILRCRVNEYGADFDTYLEWLVKDAMTSVRPEVRSKARDVWDQLVRDSEYLDMDTIRNSGFEALHHSEGGKCFAWPTRVPLPLSPRGSEKRTLNQSPQTRLLEEDGQANQKMEEAVDIAEGKSDSSQAGGLKKPKRNSDSNP